ncbi:hypothetical protein Agub_g14476 [Astrephomene gubernaculifera]|uniref:Translation initiation factor IF-2, chloroplastic n=1 Tax=Astrephomene gubernaculifera TaxID=47775 RepID=A0AAD3E3I9_9CHLO|nr:hypothetical protein Agub_g14476 [Astrephomene gubernaculifera]
MVAHANALTPGVSQPLVSNSFLHSLQRRSLGRGFGFPRCRICIVAAGPASAGPQSLTRMPPPQPQRLNGPPQQLQASRPPTNSPPPPSPNGNGNGQTARQAAPPKPPPPSGPVRPASVQLSSPPPPSLQLTRPGPAPLQLSALPSAGSPQHQQQQPTTSAPPPPRQQQQQGSSAPLRPQQQQQPQQLQQQQQQQANAQRRPQPGYGTPPAAAPAAGGLTLSRPPAAGVGSPPARPAAPAAAAPPPQPLAAKPGVVGGSSIGGASRPAAAAAAAAPGAATTPTPSSSSVSRPAAAAAATAAAAEIPPVSNPFANIPKVPPSASAAASTAPATSGSSGGTAAAAAAPGKPAAGAPLPPPVANPFASISRPQPPAAAPPPPAAAAPPNPPPSGVQRPTPPASASTPTLSPPPLQRPPPRPTQGPPGTPSASAVPPKPLGPPSALPRPTGPSGATPPPLPLTSGGAAAGSAPQQLQLQRPPSRTDPLGRQPPATAPTTAAAATDAVDVPTGQLIRPDPPTLRVLEPLMAQAGTAGTAATHGSSAGKPAKLAIEEVVEEEGLFDEEDAEFMAKGTTTKGKGKKGKRKEKVTAEMKRDARRQREAVRMDKAAARRRDKEEIFEVGEEGMTLDALAELLQVDESDIVRSLFMRGITLSMSQTLDRNTVKLVASDYEVVVVDRDPAAVTDAAKKRTEYISEEDVDELVPRPPVVTVMGHVDHGKTSLLDFIRSARVAAGEAGGITQAIGAYNTEVWVEGESRTICFLDTPGHEAFSAMRARGTQVTDIAIIIVAADDGVRPQTREAVAHAQAAGVPIVVAINKIDKPGADVERVKQELLELNLVPEEWGGNTPVLPVSAKKGTGVPDLLTQLLWVAEERQLLSNPNRPAAGTVIEANLDRKRGAVATLLVQVGTLRPGDVLRAGAAYGRVRSLTNDLGQAIPAAGPSIAVQLTGLNSVPAAGEAFEVYGSEQEAREAAAEFEDRLKYQRMMELRGGGSMVTLASLATVDEEQEALQRLNLVVKADTSGMVEALKSSLSALPQHSVALRFLLAAAGEISGSDVDLAAASGAMVLAFNLEPDDSVSAHAKRLGVSIKSYRIIYELLDDVKAAMEGKLKLVEERVPQGSAVVKAVFGSGKKRVAGAAVTEGKLSKGAYVTVRRGKAVVYDGKLSSLRRVKDAVDEVGSGLECGLGCDGFWEWAEGDVLECYQLLTKSRRLEEARATTAVDVATLQ